MTRTILVAAAAAIGLAAAPAVAQDAFKTTIPRALPGERVTAIQVDGNDVSLIYGQGASRRVVRVTPQGNQVAVAFDTVQGLNMRVDEMRGMMMRFGPDTMVMLFGSFQFNMSRGDGGSDI